MSELSDKLNAYLDQMIPEALEAAGKAIVDDLKNELNTSYYVTPAQRSIGMVNYASFEGSPPHRRTGNLRDGVVATITGETLTITSSRVADDPMVPEWLEYGTTRMASRPYMSPAMNRVPEVIDTVIKEIV